MRIYFTDLRMAFREVFSHISYVVLAVSVALIAFFFAVWLPNLGLLADVFGTSSSPIAIKAKLAWSLLLGIGTNFSWFSASYTIAIAALFGMNLAFIVYFFKHIRGTLARQEGGAAFAGVTSGAFGIGCAACGSFLLSSALSVFGAAGALALFPLRGGEFGLISVFLLFLTLILLSRRVAQSSTCNP